MDQMRKVLLPLNIMLSVAVPIFLGFFASLSVEIAVLLGMAGLVLSLQVEMFLRTERRERAEDVRARLVDALSRDKEFGAQLTTIIEGVGMVLSTTKPRAYLKIAKNELDHVISLIRGLQRESIQLNAVVPSLRDSDSVSRSFKAISMLDMEMAWWTSGDGKEWLSANQAWGKGKATVERIFIYEEPWTGPKEAIVQEHIAHGVHVYRVNREDIPTSLRRNVGIFDDGVIMEFAGWGNPDMIEKVTYSVEQAPVREAVRDFDRLRHLAHPCTNAGGPVKPELQAQSSPRSGRVGQADGDLGDQLPDGRP